MAYATLCASLKHINNSEILLAPTVPKFLDPETPTFAETARHYVLGGGEARYLAPIVSYFGDAPLKSIYPAHIRVMAETLYPSHKGSTRNRQAVTPARAVIFHGYDHGWCNLIRVRRFKTEKPVRLKAASATWLHTFCRQCDKDGLPHLAAIVLFMATTGARVSEAVALRWPEVDLMARSARLLKTKTSTNSMRSLTDQVCERIRDLEKRRGQFQHVFRYTCRHSVNERIAAVCERAGIPNKPPHTCGRRAFANMAIDLGMDVMTAMKAGGWESTSVFLEVYVQPRENSGRIVAERFNVHDFTDL